jgi:hypothetical protein
MRSPHTSNQPYLFILHRFLSLSSSLRNRQHRSGIQLLPGAVPSNPHQTRQISRQRNFWRRTCPPRQRRPHPTMPPVLQGGLRRLQSLDSPVAGGALPAELQALGRRCWCCYLSDATGDANPTRTGVRVVRLPCCETASASTGAAPANRIQRWRCKSGRRMLRAVDIVAPNGGMDATIWQSHRPRLAARITDNHHR